MADNIKIIGNIVSTSTTTRYSREDTNLISSTNIKENFGETGDYIEYYIYDNTGNLININDSYLSYKLPTDIAQTPGANNFPNTTGNIQTDNVGIVSTLTTSSALYPIIEIDPIADIQKSGYSSGEFRTIYNLFQNKISDSNTRALFVQEISKDRTEIRLKSTTLSDSDIENTVSGLISEVEGSTYQIYYLLNFGNNEQYVTTNIALNKATDGYEILFKLYQPLPLSVQLKSTLWVVEEKVTPYQFSINLDKVVTPPPPPSLRGPNFDIEIPNNGTVSTEYNTYSNLISSVQALQQTSYHQILNLMATQSVDINIDYTDFNNFIFFGSAYQRISNFYTKAKQIEDYNTLINTYTPLSSSKPSLITEINQYSSTINTLISQFDGYEYYLYFESSSYAWPKASSTKPYSLLSTSSLTVQNWYTSTTSSAYDYDYNNYDNLEYAIPVYLKDDTNNAPFLLFLNMVGHYFDNTWIYLKSITDINKANNNLEEGISKDLVYERLKSLGVHLYNSQAGEDVNQYLIGANTGSSEWDNNTTITGSYLNNIPRKDLVSELYKRIYHNLPLLVKTKGTVSGLEHLITTFGISGSILNVKEYGGANKSEQLKGYNTDKVRIVNNTISGSVLSHELSLQPPYTSTTDFRDEDTHYVDISFSPQNQIDTRISKSIASNAPTWSLDDYIGDPRQLYNNSYSDLDTQRKLYFETGVAGYPGFTGSLMDYNGFIRLIQYFDNALFKMLEDFTPERTSLSTGVTFNSPVLERNKVTYANPTNSTTQSVPSGEISASTISPQYSPLYNNLQGDKKPYFDGALSGSVVDIQQYFTDNPNPYLGDWNVWNAQHSITQSIDTNSFAHSDWNVLLNNVSKSLQSIIRKKIEYTGNYLPTGSITSSAELQDSYLTLRSYNTSRYEGSKLTSKLYNTYTTGSYTGSDGRTIQTGDISYGKTATIDRQSYKIGWVKNISSQNLNFYDKTQIQLKYLVDKDLNLIDLTLKNNNLIEVQNTFKSGDKVVVSLSDALKPSFQKTLDGTKSIFRGGYSYDPILFRENNEVLNFRFISGSTSQYYPGIKEVMTTWYYWKNFRESIYNMGGINPASSPINDDSGNTNGVGYYIDNTFNTNTSAPLATAYSATSYNSIYGSTNINNSLATKPATRFDFQGQSQFNPVPSYQSQYYIHTYIQSTGGWNTINGGNGPNFVFNDGTRKAYFFDILNFNNTSSISGGFNTELVDVTGNGAYLYECKRSSTYNISSYFTVYTKASYFDYTSPSTFQATQFSNIPLNGKWPYNAYGFSYKIFCVLEKSATPSNANSWQYVGATRLKNVVGANLAQYSPQWNGNTNIIYVNAGLGGGQPTYQNNNRLFSTSIEMELVDDTTGNNYITTNLNIGEVLRMRLVMLDLDQFFNYGRNFEIEIGRPQFNPAAPTVQASGTGFDFINFIGSSPRYFQVSDAITAVTTYNQTVTVSGNNLFTAQGNTISFLSSSLFDMVSPFSQISIFEPTGSTSNLYSPVIDNVSIQSQDLIRIGSMNNPSPDYYTVVTASFNTSGPFINSSVSANFIRDYDWTPIGTAKRYSTITFSFTSLIRTLPQSLSEWVFFSNVFNSTNKEFTISNIPASNPLNVLNGRIFKMNELKQNTVSISATQQVTTIYVGLDLLYIWFPPPFGYWQITPASPSIPFNGTSTATYTQILPPTYNVIVDRNVNLTNVSNIAQNFAILRPKPDETSVIINFHKEIGEVSQTVLIPQDANEEIKSKIGTIYQNIT